MSEKGRDDLIYGDAMNEVKTILENAREALSNAEAGLVDVRTGHPDKVRRGASDVVVYGKSFGEILRRLRSKTGVDFDGWADTHTSAMASDPDLKYLYGMRNDVLHEGSLRPVHALSTSG